MLLAIDIGNTRIKAAVFEHGSLLEHSVFPKLALEENIAAIIQKHSAISDVVVSSVGNDSIKFNISPQITVHSVSNNWDFPFRNLYATPSTLGIDRMVLAAGAVLQYPDQNRLVIDSGTCITYDLIDSADNYQGGAISPGIKLRYQALHNYTAKLPLLNAKIPDDFTGKTTAESMHSGVVNGVLYEIDGFIDAYQMDYPNFIIILTGGDADFLATRLKNTIFANSNFLLESLNRTFQYNIKND